MRNCNAIPGRTMKMDSWVCLWIPKVNIPGGLAGGCKISLCISESPSAGGAPQNGPSKGVLDRSTPLDGGQIYRCHPRRRQRFRHGSRPNRGNSCPATIFDYETLLTPSFGKKELSKEESKYFVTGRKFWLEVFCTRIVLGLY